MTRQFNMKKSDPSDLPDLLECMHQMTKGERELFLQIKRLTDYKTNRAVLDTSNLTRAEQNQRSKHYQGLRNLDIIRRVQQNQITTLSEEVLQVPKGTFMINPEFIRPSNKHVEEIYFQWNQLR